MELRDFAMQVLWGETLEEKLRLPHAITDESPGMALDAPPMPGRPSELSFKTPGGSRSEFPGLHQLEQTRERGRLLHFFANHELLATELMALVLLRFPDAPSAFRQDVLRTLKDEQVHTRLYLKRMEACGIHFGELPVSGYFWKSISGMESPLDYVAGLSLTFEQANLDYCRHFARGFDEVGDEPTARLLERIYQDEIGHVAYGLKWFRRWKDTRCSDWEAFCGQLKLPLSPNRAKGVGFNIEGRRDAGFDPGFIDELNVYAHSKGRTPCVYHFNPFAELMLAPGTLFQPVKAQVALMRDLENLPQFLCRQDDIVLVSQRPSTVFLSGIKLAGIPLPEFVQLEEGRIRSGDPIRERKLGGLRPWAWSPDSVERLRSISSQVRGPERRCFESFSNERKALYSKSWSADFLRALLQEHGEASWLCPLKESGETARSYQAVLDAIERIRNRGHHKVVLKKAFGLAGHDMIRLWEPQLLDKQKRWMQKVLDTGGELVVEPWLERVIDFSLQLEMGPASLKLKGYAELFNDRGGQFQAVALGPDHARKLPQALLELFQDQPKVLGGVHKLFHQVLQKLRGELGKIGFIGPVGVDAFAYRDEQGSIRLKPVVEINPRYTMGRLGVELMKYVSPGKWGLMSLVNRAAIQKMGWSGFREYADTLMKQWPWELEGHPVKKISQGILCLNDPDQATEYQAIFRVNSTKAEAGSIFPENAKASPGHAPGH